MKTYTDALGYAITEGVYLLGDCDFKEKVISRNGELGIVAGPSTILCFRQLKEGVFFPLSDLELESCIIFTEGMKEYEVEVTTTDEHHTHLYYFVYASSDEEAATKAKVFYDMHYGFSSNVKGYQVMFATAEVI